MEFKPFTEEEFLAATEAARIADETEPRAVSARYDAETGRIEIELKNGCMFAFPARYGQGLQGATEEQLAAVEILYGEALHWEELDADLGVPQLVSGMFGSKAWMRQLGQLGGQAKSEAKAQASRENGKKGGRPRKTPQAAPLKTSPESKPGKASPRRRAA
jgi:hypothetical protein